MKEITLPLSPKQKAWLKKLVNHEKKGYWLSPTAQEENKIRIVLINQCYNAEEQTFLREIADYYKNHIWECGTLNNPL